MKDAKDYTIFWQEVVERVKKIKSLDDAALVFGANTRGSGHKYEILPVLSDNEVLHFENRNGFELPLAYRTYLKTFGSGGAGPFYGVADFREYIMPKLFTEPFPYNETVDYDEMDDDQPVWNYPGLAFICTAGCGTDFMIELNGSLPGRIWCDWTEECSTTNGSLPEFYQGWLDMVETALGRYHQLKSIASSKNWLGRSNKLTFDDIAKQMPCTFRERRTEDGFSTIPEDQIHVHFDQTPGKVILNREKEVLEVSFENMPQIS